jgi:hypothetical protein
MIRVNPLVKIYTIELFITTTITRSLPGTNLYMFR